MSLISVTGCDQAEDVSPHFVAANACGCVTPCPLPSEKACLHTRGNCALCHMEQLQELVSVL